MASLEEVLREIEDVGLTAQSKEIIGHITKLGLTKSSRLLISKFYHPRFKSEEEIIKSFSSELLTKLRFIEKASNHILNSKFDDTENNLRVSSVNRYLVNLFFKGVNYPNEYINLENQSQSLEETFEVLSRLNNEMQDTISELTFSILSNYYIKSNDNSDPMDVKTSKIISPQEALIFKLKDKKSFCARDWAAVDMLINYLGFSNKNLDLSKAARETLFSSLVYSDNLYEHLYAIIRDKTLNGFIDNYVAALRFDYPNKQKALDCLSSSFDSLCEFRARHNEFDELDYLYGKSPDNQAEIKDIGKLLETEPLNENFYDLVKRIMTRLDHDKRILKRLKNVKNLDKEYYEDEDALFGKGLRFEGNTKFLEILSYGKIKILGELTECFELQISGYLTIQRLGEGGTREAYHVIHEQRNHHLALKIDKKLEDIKKERAQEFFARKSFDETSRRERLVLMGLTHENLARMWDFGTYEGRNYIVEDLVEGKTLEQLVKEKGKLNTREFMMVFAPVVKVINYLTEKGYVHRDIKPDNILVSDDMLTIKLTDLQNATKLGQGIIQSGESFGSLRTTAPDIILGGQANFYSEAYSMAACMYYSVTGEMPYDFGQNGETLEQLRNRISTIYDNEKEAERIRMTMRKVVPNYRKIDQDRDIEAVEHIIEAIVPGLLSQLSCAHFTRVNAFTNQINYYLKEFVGVYSNLIAKLNSK